MFETLAGQKRVPPEWIGTGVFGLEPSLEQLLLLEFAENGWLEFDQAGGVALTEAGVAVSDSRLDKWPSWAEVGVRADAPPLPPMSSRLEMAIKGYIARHSDKWLSKRFTKLFDQPSADPADNSSTGKSPDAPSH